MAFHFLFDQGFFRDALLDEFGFFFASAHLHDDLGFLGCQIFADKCFAKGDWPLTTIFVSHTISELLVNGHAIEKRATFLWWLGVHSKDWLLLVFSNPKRHLVTFDGQLTIHITRPVEVLKLGVTENLGLLLEDVRRHQ